MAVYTGADRLLALFERYRPNVVITYGNGGGGYNHPDHVHVDAITEAACERSDIPSKLYFIARRRGDWQKMRERLEALGMVFPVPQISEERLKAMAELEARITTTVDVRPHIDRKRARRRLTPANSTSRGGAGSPTTSGVTCSVRNRSSACATPPVPRSR